MLRIENPRWYLQTLPVRCEAAHPGTMICSNRLPLMVVDALRTGLHAAAPMRPANSHVKSPCAHGAKYSKRNSTGERLPAAEELALLVHCVERHVEGRLAVGTPPLGVAHAGRGDPLAGVRHRVLDAQPALHALDHKINTGRDRCLWEPSSLGSG